MLPAIVTWRREGSVQKSSRRAVAASVNRLLPLGPQCAAERCRPRLVAQPHVAIGHAWPGSGVRAVSSAGGAEIGVVRAGRIAASSRGGQRAIVDDAAVWPAVANDEPERRARPGTLPEVSLCRIQCHDRLLPLPEVRLDDVARAAPDRLEADAVVRVARETAVLGAHFVA